MKKTKKMQNPESLEKEINRLRIEARKKERELSKNMEYLSENSDNLFFNSFFSGKRSTGQKMAEAEGFFWNEKLNSIISKISDRIADRVAEGIDNLMDKIFHKQKH